jgi:hypothetical protein
MEQKTNYCARNGVSRIQGTCGFLIRYNKKVEAIVLLHQMHQMAESLWDHSCTGA